MNDAEIVVIEWPCRRCENLAPVGELERHGGECEYCKTTCLVCTDLLRTPEEQAARRCAEHLTKSWPDRCPDCNKERPGGTPWLPWHEDGCPYTGLVGGNTFKEN